MIVRKIRKVGSSLYVILNKTYLKALGLKVGDYVIERLTKKGISIRKLEVKK